VFEIVVYKQDSGRCPYDDWFLRLRDKKAQARIITRLRQVQAGNLGDHAAVGEGVLELRVHVGAGYRVYCGRSGAELVVLLCGGDKSSQSKDIQRAKEFWRNWRKSGNEKP
jgi:putative addiction module killer protein